MNPTTCFIALIDDHVLLRNGLATLVNNFEGYKVMFEADNGEDFIRQLKPPHYPDIVLLDITMPKMNGFDTADWIRVNLPNTKILVLSMMDHDSAIIRMLKAGAKGYLLKDSKPATVKTALDQIKKGDFFFNDLISSKLYKYISKKPDSSGKPESDDTIHFTDREKTYLVLACSEKTHKEIAEEMNVSPRTIDSYRDAIFEKTGVNTRVGLVLYAIRSGFFTVKAG